MADQRSRLQMDILARVQGIQEVDRLARAVDDTGDEMRSAAADAKLLDRAVDELSDEIAELNRELLQTGDVEVFEKLNRDRSTLRTLQRMRRELGEIGDEGDRAGRGFVSGLGDAFAAIPPRLKGALIAGVASAAVSTAPLLGAAVAGAVLGGVGAGGIIGGVLSASRDPRVGQAAQGLVQNIEQPFNEIGKAFVDPVLDSLDILGQAGRGLLKDLTPGIKALAPEVRDLAEGIAGMMEELGPGIADALAEARPVLRAIANELPELGDAFSDVLSAISEESDGAILGLTTIFRLTADIVRGVGEVIAFLSRAFEGALNLELAVVGFAERATKHIPFVSNLFGESREGIEDLKGSLLAAGEEGANAGEQIAGGFQQAGLQIDATNSILLRHRDILRAQTDPMFALIDAQIRNRETQQAYTEAVDEFGRNSPEAQAALLDQGKAALDLQAALADAAGTFDGKFTPAQMAAFKAAGFTKAELKRLEEAFDDAREAGDQAAKNYFLNVTTRYRSIGEPPPFGNAAAVGSFRVAMQHGGEVFGPAGIDQVEARLTAGEFVVRREQAQKHLELLQAINSGSGGGAPVAAQVRGGDGGGVFTGQLFLDSGEYLGTVRGEVRREMAAHDRGLRRRAGAGSGAAR